MTLTKIIIPIFINKNNIYIFFKITQCKYLDIRMKVKDDEKLSLKLQARNQEFFWAGQVSGNRETSINTSQKKDSTGKNFLVFSPSKIFLKVHFN